MKNKGGQMMIVGIMVLVMAIIIFVSTLPAIQTSINDAKGCSYLNCAGYVDADSSAAACGSTNQTYVSTLTTNTLGCTVIDLAIPLLILGILAAIIVKIMYDKMVAPPQPDYGMGAYPGY